MFPLTEESRPTVQRFVQIKVVAENKLKHYLDINNTGWAKLTIKNLQIRQA